MRQRLAASVDVEDRAPARDVGQADVDLAREAAGPQERLVEDIQAVRGGDDDDLLGAVEAVHLDEQLV